MSQMVRVHTDVYNAAKQEAKLRGVTIARYVSDCLADALKVAKKGQTMPAIDTSPVRLSNSLLAQIEKDCEETLRSIPKEIEWRLRHYARLYERKHNAEG